MQHEMWWKFMVNACIKTSSPDARPRSTFFAGQVIALGARHGIPTPDRP